MIAITVSVNYSDILNLILAQNQKFFEKWIIITSLDDTATIKLIKESGFNNIDLVYFNFKIGKNQFNKGGAIKTVQSTIKEGETILILDSDIYLPDNFLETLPKNIERDTIYGVNQRLDYHTYKNYLSKKCDYKFIDATRKYRHWVGFFQLYCASEKYIYRDSEDCSKSDITFMHSFLNRIIIKDLTVTHFGKNGVNWKGRDGNNGFII